MSFHRHEKLNPNPGPADHNAALMYLIDEWRTWQYAKNLSARTVQERVSAVLRLTQWCETPAHAVTAQQIVRWLAIAGREWSPNTRWTYHANISAWFLWLQKLGHRADNPMVNIDSPKRTKGQPRPVTDHELRRLLGVRANRRTRAMIVLAAFQGLRVHEIAKIKGEDFDLVGRTLVVTGKGAFTATLPLHHRTVEVAYGMPRRGYWFPGTDGGCQRRESVSGTIKEAMLRAGITGSAHSLRHWFGTALVESGVDLRTTQTLLRHQNLATTEIYTKVSDGRRGEAINLLDPGLPRPA